MLPPVFGVLFDGLAYGMLLFLLSVGQSVTLGMMNFINLAHCSFAMLGGYLTVALMIATAGRFSPRCPAHSSSPPLSASHSSERCFAASIVRANSTRCC